MASAFNTPIMESTDTNFCPEIRERGTSENHQRIFTKGTITMATFFGGPLAAGFLIGKNYKVFGNDPAARNSLFIGILTTIFLFTGLLILPENVTDHIPETLIPLIYTVIIALIVEKSQGSQISSFLKNGGRKASGWSAAGYGFAGLAITGIFIALFIYTSPLPGYEKKKEIGENVVLHYEKHLDEQKVNRFIQTLERSGFLDQSEGADLFLSEIENEYKLLFVIPDSDLLGDLQLISDFQLLEQYLNFSLNKDPEIEIAFTDPMLNEEYSLPESKDNVFPVYTEFQDLQVYKINDYHTIYYNNIMPVADVKVVEDAIKRLKTYFPENQAIDIIFLNTGEDYVLKLFVSKDTWNNPLIIEKFKSTSEYIQYNGIAKNLHLKLIDPTDKSEFEIN